MKDYIIRTERLGLRNWIAEDLQPFFEMNSDPEVMRFFPKVHTERDTKDLVDRMQSSFNDHGYCYFATDILETGEFIGMIGILDQTFKSEYTPNVDIGWRLKRSAWGKGYATEGARACLDFGLHVKNLPAIYSFAPMINKASEAVMQKIGMRRVGEFKHPKLQDTPELEDCVVYRNQ